MCFKFEQDKHLDTGLSREFHFPGAPLAWSCIGCHLEAVNRVPFPNSHLPLWLAFSGPAGGSCPPGGATALTQAAS